MDMRVAMTKRVVHNAAYAIITPAALSLRECYDILCNLFAAMSPASCVDSHARVAMQDSQRERPIRT